MLNESSKPCPMQLSNTNAVGDIDWHPLHVKAVAMPTRRKVLKTTKTTQNVATRQNRKESPTFRMLIVLSFSGSRSPRSLRLLLNLKSRVLTEQ